MESIKVVADILFCAQHVIDLTLTAQKKINTKRDFLFNNWHIFLKRSLHLENLKLLSLHRILNNISAEYSNWQDIDYFV